MRRLIIGVLSVLLVAGMWGCGAGEDPTPETMTESPLATTSPLPTPTPVLPELSSPDAPSVRLPTSGKGTILGRFVDYESGDPGPEIVVYLGDLTPVELQGEKSHLVTMNPDSSPSTATDREGWFVFEDVEPGTYAMVMWTPGNSWVVSDPDTQLNILVTVEADRITDLGEIKTNLPG